MACIRASGHTPLTRNLLASKQISVLWKRVCFSEKKANMRAFSRRCSGVVYAARTAAVKTVTTTAPVATGNLFSPASVEASVAALATYHLAIFALMIIFSTQAVRSIVKSRWVFLPLALGYLLLLANSWSPDTISIIMPGSLAEGLSDFGIGTIVYDRPHMRGWGTTCVLCGANAITCFKPQFFPNIKSIMTLFQRPLTAASWLVHVMAINLFLGRSMYLEGKEMNIPTWHSLILACVVGPMGFLSHVVTKLLFKSAAPQTTILKSQGSTITILPYDT